MHVRRIVMQSHPFPPVDTGEPHAWMRWGQWPAFWIAPPEKREPPFVVLYRLAFELDRPCAIRFHVSADERYVLWIDGERAGRGPETGDVDAWCYDSYEVELDAGRHAFHARVSSLGPMAIFPQVSIAHGFLLAAEGGAGDRINTGVAEWTCARVGHWSFAPNEAGATWARETIAGSSALPGEPERFGLAWTPAVRGLRGRSRDDASYEWTEDHPLCPATLPPQYRQVRTLGRVVHAESAAQTGGEAGECTDAATAAAADVRATCPGWRSADVKGRGRVLETPLDSRTATGERGQAWQWCADGHPITVPPMTRERVVFDLGDYVCGYPGVRVTGGAGARFGVAMHEALYVRDEAGKLRKRNRDQVDGMLFTGAPDTFLPDGVPATFETLWWRCGRYVELTVETAGAPLTLERVTIEETRYPLETSSRFECSHPGPAAFAPVAVRSIQMCAHETHMDCPYYEQQMWVGDMRVQLLTSYCMMTDDRLAKKCIRMAAASRRAGEPTLCRWPVRQRMVIPSFSLWFISMVHDYALWRGNLDFVRTVMPDVRATMDAMLQRRHASGLYQVPRGWNYVDWCRWESGSPSLDPDRPTSVNNWQLVLVLRQLSALEGWLGEPELAERWERLARALAGRLDASCWDTEAGLYRDLPDEPRFSEHAQALAVLSGCVSDDRRASIRERLLSRGDRARASLYFQFYLFEMYRELGMSEALWAALQPYFDMAGQGFRTTPETLERPRSDCHAWSAHPYYHFFTTVLGIRPAAPGFRACRVDPMPGPLQWARGTLVHPLGCIDVSLHGKMQQVTVPPGVQRLA